MTKKTYKIISICAFAFILLIAPLTNQRHRVCFAEGIAEIAIEQSSGTVMHEKNADVKLPMASTTKIMTALIIAEECDLSEVIEVPERAVGVEGSSIYLKHGEKISVKDLLYGLMLRSGNDASVALAIKHSGTIEKFVDKMNEKANEIGALDTHFCNPNGLPCENHYTTARDLAKITRVAMDNEIFNKVVSTISYSGDFRSFTNKNKLLKKIEGANGVKTGYTEKAGRCLVSSVKRGEMDVICVVLNCYDMFERSEKIIENCFIDYSISTLSKGRLFEYKGRLYNLGEDCRILIKTGKEIEYEIEENNKTGELALKIFCEKHLIFTHNLFTI